MPAVITEAIGSGSVTKGKSPSGELKWVITGTSSDSIALGLATSTAPLVFHMLPLTNLSVVPTDFQVWDVTASYAEPDDEDDQEDPETAGMSFDTSGGSMHITNSLETTGTYSATAEPAPSFGGAINVSKDEIKGADVTIAALQFTETHKFLASTVTPTKIKQIARNTGKTNSKIWRGFAIGELLFMGCSGSLDKQIVAITYTFRASENIDDLTVGPIEEISKTGHELLWVYYMDQGDEYTDEIVKGPRAAYVERIYEEFDFDDLGLPDWEGEDE